MSGVPLTDVTVEVQSERTPARADDREAERRALLLLHIAVACPLDAAELSARIGRPQQAIREDLNVLMGQGVIHLQGATLRASGAARVIAEASSEELRGIHSQVLAEFESGAEARPATLAALAESGCRDDALMQLLIRAVGDDPEDASVLSALSVIARARGEHEDEVRLLRAADAAARGRSELVLTLTEELLTSGSEETQVRAALLAAGAHIENHRLERASVLFTHVGAERIGIDGAWAAVTAIGQGDLAAAREWRASMGSNTLTSHAAGVVDLVDGLLLSVTADDEAALDLLARSVSTLSPLGADLLLPETPAALAALVALGRGEPAIAEVMLERALRANLGGETGRRRHLLLTSWALMVQGRLDAADRRLDELDGPHALGDRDLLLYWCLHAGLAHRRADLAAMREAWREIRGHSFGLRMTLFDLLPLGEMMVVAARVRDSRRVGRMMQEAVEVLASLGNPISWSAPLHWQGVQAAFQSEDPAALIPHANALTKAGATSTYAATLARAGQTWLSVLRREANFESVEESVRALAKTGHIWDASRLAGQAALQHPDREHALSMMQLAREILKDHARTSASTRKSSVLTSREVEVGRLVLDGQGYRAIGEQLFIAPKTVEHHVARIRSRLGASSRSELLTMLHDVLSDHGE